MPPHRNRQRQGILHFSLFTFHFKAWLFQALNGFLVLDDLLGLSLCQAGGYELELSFAAEVLAGLGVKTSSKLLPPKAVEWICREYGIDLAG